MNQESLQSPICSAGKPDLPPAGIHTVLVPVEIDERSQAHLQFADTLAGQLQARLVLLHVFKSFDYSPPHSTARQYDHVNAVLEKNAEASLIEFFHRLPGLPRVRAAKAIVKSGMVELVVVETAKDIHADLILLSTHAYTGVKHLLLGSKAEYILKHSPCPVLILPPCCIRRHRDVLV